MTIHSRSLVGVFDDRDTRIMSAAYRMACDMLDANGGDAAERSLRFEIAAALLEAADDGFSDAPALAQAAVDLVFVDAIEIDFS